MSALMKGFVIAIVQVLLVSAIGAKFLYDRAHYPRVWAPTAPYDPNLPIRGRYVSISVLVDGKGVDASGDPGTFYGRFAVEGDRLIAIKDANGPHMFLLRGCGDAQCWQFYEPLAYFIPEHVKDPSLRHAGETLWVEVTVPPKGAPRPIRLGVKKDEDPAPVELRLE